MRQKLMDQVTVAGHLSTSIGSAHDDADLELLKTVGRQRLASGQGVLELGRGFGGGRPQSQELTHAH